MCFNVQMSTGVKLREPHDIQLMILRDQKIRRPGPWTFDLTPRYMYNACVILVYAVVSSGYLAGIVAHVT